jgi:hypothetical protein
LFSTPLYVRLFSRFSPSSKVEIEAMLQEIILHRQDEPERRKRWFQDNYFDLFTWQNLDNEIVAFQLCYDRKGTERVISWDYRQGFEHSCIDDGEAAPHRNMTPVFTSCTMLPAESDVSTLFAQASAKIDKAISRFVLLQLHTFQEKQVQAFNDPSASTANLP